MQYVSIIHEVEDYLAWKTIFDGAINIRKDAGEISYQLLKSIVRTVLNRQRQNAGLSLLGAVRC